jgi:hypothetical protein
MKRFALPLPLGALAFALACTDGTAPDPRASLTPRAPALGQDIGNLPPPPVDAAIEITVFSTPVTGFFTGVYFANGAAPASVTAALAANDQELAFNGTAWLRLDNDNTQAFGSSASANARFQIIHALTPDEKLSGRGTLMIKDALGVTETIRIVDVTKFVANPNCDAFAIPCAHIEFTATVDSDPIPGTIHIGHADAFDREVCIYEVEGGLVFDCPEIGS